MGYAFFVNIFKNNSKFGLVFKFIFKQSKNLFKVKEKRYNKKMRKKYPSDITRAQFEHIRGILASGKKKTAPRKVDLYEIFCAILYLLKSGCQWRMLPETFPKWNTVYYYFSIWNKAQAEKPSLLHQCLKKIDWRGSYKTGAEVLQEQVDAQSVKNTDSEKRKRL